MHWPFCLSKCPYCDFNSHVRPWRIRRSALRARHSIRDRSGDARALGRTVSTIFFGGGTPSLMQPETVGAILDSIGKHWTVAGNVEVSLEANPTSVEGDGAFVVIAPPASIACRSGGRALDDQSLKEPRPFALGAGSARRHRGGALDLRSLFVRSDLCPSATNTRRLDQRTEARDFGSGRTSRSIN